MSKSETLLKIAEALKSAPPPENDDDLTAREVVTEHYETIQDMRTAGYKFEAIAEIISDAGEDDDVNLTGTTLTTYFRDETKARRKEANRIKREARKAESEGTELAHLATGNETDSDTAKSPTSKSVSPKRSKSLDEPKQNTQVMTATLETDDDEPQ